MSAKVKVLNAIFIEKNKLSTEGFNPLNIWISSWASAPDHLVQEVLDFLKNIWNTQIELVKTVEEKMVFPIFWNLK